MTQDQIEKLFLPWDQVEDWVEYQTIDEDGGGEASVGS